MDEAWAIPYKKSTSRIEGTGIPDFLWLIMHNQITHNAPCSNYYVEQK
jgi:hypothetical protein